MGYKKNYGLIVEKPPVEDWIFLGSNSKLANKIVVPDGNWYDYLTRYEKQAKAFDTWNCVAFSACNSIEIYFKYLIKNNLLLASNIEWLTINGYLENGEIDLSDRFVGINAGTKVGKGNTGSNVANAIYEYSVIPEKMLPFTEEMDEEEYYNKKVITQEMKDLAKEFKKRFNIHFETFWLKDIKEVLQYACPQVYVNAWEKDDTGIYVNTADKWNHAVVRYRSITKQVFDHYDPFLKSLSLNYNYYPSGYKYTVTEVIRDNMDTEKFLIDNDLLFVRNQKTGQFGRIMQKELKVVETKDRGTLLLLDNAVRTNGRNLTAEEWELLPKKSF